MRGGGARYAREVRAQLIAVQAEMRHEDFLSAEAYRRKVLSLAESAVEGLAPADEVPRLLAFPEAIAWPLPLLLGAAGAAEPARSLREASLAYLRRHAAGLGGWALRSRRFGPSLLHLPRAVEVGRLHLETFAEAARLARATVVAGTLLGPAVGFEASRGWHVRDPRPRNRAHLFGPGGAWLGGGDKVHFTAGLEARLGLVPGRAEDLRPVATPLGAVGVAVCLDAFHDELVARLDGQGARVLVQPSANFADWGRPWPADAAMREGEAWLTYGLRRALTGRQHLRAGVNPMLVGEVLGVRASGRSSIVGGDARTVDGEADGAPDLLALAPHPDREALVRAVVELG